MATRNIQMNYYNGGSYDQLYPQVNLTNITGILPVANGGTGENNLNSLRTSLGLSNIGEYNWTQICNQTTSAVWNGNNYNIPVNRVLSNYNAFIVKISNITVSGIADPGYSGFISLGINSSTNNFRINTMGYDFSFSFNNKNTGSYDLNGQVFIFHAFNIFKTTTTMEDQNQIYSKVIIGPEITISFTNSNNFNSIVGYIGFSFDDNHMLNWSFSANLAIYAGTANF